MRAEACTEGVCFPVAAPEEAQTRLAASECTSCKAAVGMCCMSKETKRPRSASPGWD